MLQARSPLIALITGCSGGIGLALARELKGYGYQVFATARQPGDLARLQAEGFAVFALDVNDQQQIDCVVRQLTAQQGRLDLLVNNAGYGAIGPVLDISPERLALQFQTNVFSVVAMTKAALPLLQQSRGTVLNIGSVSASLVTPFAGVYCASKAALHAISEALRMELEPLGVQVLLAVTGAVDTGFADRASQLAEQVLSEDSSWWPYRDGVRRRARASQDFPTPATEYARALVQALQTPQRQLHIRVGRGSWLLPLLKAVLPSSWLHLILKRKFGLSAH
ncbi:MAG: SDR family oxidoreductase [Rheinheimera sp.]|nr:SDR family oxidoreductase [Rheinheimera sp.]